MNKLKILNSNLVKDWLKVQGAPMSPPSSNDWANPAGTLSLNPGQEFYSLDQKILL